MRSTVLLPSPVAALARGLADAGRPTLVAPAADSGIDPLVTASRTRFGLFGLGPASAPATMRMPAHRQRESCSRRTWKDERLASDEHLAVGSGTLLLADISGYTAFLQAVGAAHAADMAAGTFVPKAYPLLTSLLDGIVEEIAPPFVLSKLEGDAVFAFAADGELDVHGRSLLDRLTACYEAYRARLDEARELMVCSCDACLSIGGLELKFVLHHGRYILQSVADRHELLGPEVTISHLLLKNHAPELIGRRAYALITEPAAAHLDIPLERALPITEEYQHYAPVRASVLALP